MNVVVASNNLFRRELSSYILSEAGYDVQDVDTTAALAALPEIDLLLIDDHLTQHDSHELHRILDRHDHLAMLYITVAEPHDDDDHPTAERTAYLAWPYQAEELLSCVETLLAPTY